MSAAQTTSSEKKRTVTKTDPKRDAEAREKLITARIGLLLKHSFFGNLATRLQLINADDWCSTAATDGRRFYYNSEFICRHSTRQLEFLFGHEVLHVVYDHMGRRGDRDPQLYNCAADYAVNVDLVDSRVGEIIQPCLFDVKYRGMSSEEIYDELYENAEKIDINELMKRMLDEHVDGDDDGNGDGDGDGDGQQGGRRPRLSRAEREAIRDEIKEAMLSAAQQAGAGNLPNGIKRLIDRLTQPKMNWREIIRQQIESQFKSDFTWLRPSRRGWHMDAVLPGMKPGEMIDVAVAIDTSGSMTDTMLRDILAEVRGIMEQFQEFRIDVWTFDTQVYNHQVFTQDNLDEIISYEPQGGGGTMFEANWEYMRSIDLQPKRLIMFTDGYPCGSWGEEDYCDTIFIVHGNKTIQAPFGVTAYYEEG
jgi:predicted metal-dependent peptidase